MPNIFLSYRREDAGAEAGRIYDRLAAHFGPDRVFRDVDDIEPGEDFVEAIRRTIASADVLIAVIGPSWIDIRGESGRRRLTERKDLVRNEIMEALKRRIRVIPVLVRGARMPRVRELPKPLVALARRQALDAPDALFHAAMDRLIAALEKRPAFQGLETVASVGLGGRNDPSDVAAVQQMLRRAGEQPGPADGKCGPRTVAAIRSFQARNGLKADGLLVPDGPGWPKLTAPPKADWSGDSSQWSQEKKLASLEPEFRARVDAVLAALRGQGFQPRIVYGWRSVEVQKRLVAEGRSKVRFSFHNAQKPDATPAALAVDLIDSRYLWTAAAESNGFWRALGAAAKAQGLVWGGDWKSFPDLAHIQGLANSELAKVKMASEVG